jgi:hypothetical protein
VEKLLRSVGLVKLLEKIDTEYAVTMCQAGCSRCKGKLHRTDYPRKPRGFAAILILAARTEERGWREGGGDMTRVNKGQDTR